MSTNPDTFTGAYAELAIVEPDFGDSSESESVVGGTMGETTLTNDATNSEFNLHELRDIQREELKDAWTLEFASAAIADFTPLETAGIIDSNGNYQGAQTVQIRLYFWETEAKNTFKGVVELSDVNLNITDGSFPVDSSELSFRGFVNGGLKFGKTT